MVSFLVDTGVQTIAGFSPLSNVMTLLDQFGFFRVVLPFLLIFSLFYAILMKTKVLGEPKDPWMKSVPAIISMAAAFFVISSTPVVNVLLALMPQASFMLVIALFLMMIITFVGGGDTLTGLTKNKWVIGSIGIILIVVFLGIVGSATPNIPILSGLAQALMGNLALPELTAEAVSTVIAILVIFGIPAIIIGLVITSKNT